MLTRLWRKLRQQDRVEELEYSQRELLRDMSKLVDRNIELRDALKAISEQPEPQHPTGTWARDVARRAILGEEES